MEREREREREREYFRESSLFLFFIFFIFNLLGVCESESQRQREKKAGVWLESFKSGPPLPLPAFLPSTSIQSNSLPSPRAAFLCLSLCMGAPPTPLTLPFFTLRDSTVRASTLMGFKFNHFRIVPRFHSPYGPPFHFLYIFILGNGPLWLF